MSAVSISIGQTLLHSQQCLSSIRQTSISLSLDPQDMDTVMEWAHTMSDDDTYSSREGSDVEADSSDSESQVGSVASCWSAG